MKLLLLVIMAAATAGRSFSRAVPSLGLELVIILALFPSAIGLIILVDLCTRTVPDHAVICSVGGCLAAFLCGLVLGIREEIRILSTRAISSTSATSLDAIKTKLFEEISTYRREQNNDTGKSDPATQAFEDLQSALIEPYWAEFAPAETAQPTRQRCAVVADDKQGILLAFDVTIQQFHLLRWIKSTNKLKSLGVSGDAVGCFMAR